MSHIITKYLKRQLQTEKSCKTENGVLGFIALNFKYKNREMMLPLYKVHTWNTLYDSGAHIYNET